MKNKIRRAFDLTKPNVLHQIQDDLPAPAKTAKPKQKRKLSDRAAQFIATAASIAIFIGAVFGGIAYYKDYFRGQGPSGDGGNALHSGPNHTGGTHVDIDWVEPVETEPQNTVDYENTEEGLYVRAAAIIAPDSQSGIASTAPLIVSSALTDEKGETYRDLVLEYYDFQYHFRFLAANGALLSLAVERTAAQGYMITKSAAAWIALMDLDPAHYGITQYAEYEVSLAQAKVDYVDQPGGLQQFYRVKIQDYRHQAIYDIDIYSGEILFKQIDDSQNISLIEAEKIVTEAVLAEREDCYIFSSYQVDGSYCIQVCCTDGPTVASATAALICFEYYVNFHTGEIQAFDKGLSAWSEDTAMEAATAYGKANGCYPLSCDYQFRSGMQSYYNIGMTYENGDDGIFYIQVYEIYNSLMPPADTSIAIFKALEAALAQYSWTMEEVRILKISENAGFFGIYYEVGGNGFNLEVDGNGNVLHDSGVTEALCPEMPAESIGWKSARNICLADCGRSINALTGFTWDYAEGCYWMELYFTDVCFTYQVDAMDGTLIFDDPVVDGMITYEQAWEAAVVHADCLEEFMAGALTDTVYMLDPSDGSYWFAFRNGDINWSITIDAYTGEVLSALSADTTVPDDRIVEDIAIRLAANYADCLDEYEAGTLTDVAVKFDEDRYVYWVYFNHAGTHWEIEVDPGSGEVLSAQCWEQDIAVDYPCIVYEYKLEIENQTVLLIVSPGEVIYYSLLNTETGEPIEITDSVPPGSRSKKEAMQAFAEQLGLETFTSGSVALLGQLESGKLFYCVVIPMDGFSHVALLDPDTLEIYCQDTITQ